MFATLPSYVLVLLISRVAQFPKEPDFSGEWELVTTNGAASDPAPVLTIRQTITRTTLRDEPMTPWFSAVTLERHFSTGVVSATYEPATSELCQTVAISSAALTVANPEVIAGAWEIDAPDGIDGIFLSIHTHAQDVAGQPGTSSQNVHVRVYHRDAGNETGGWYTAGTNEPALFDGEHLRLRAVSDGPVIDVTFDPGKQRWVGTWTRSGKSQDVTLERPHFSDSASTNDLLGDWQGVSNPAHLYRASTRLHIYKSRDGALSAWMDRSIAPYDQRQGELLQVAASENRGIVLTTTPPAGMTYRFRGALSVDGSTLNGMWESETGTGGTLNAETSFRRIR